LNPADNEMMITMAGNLMTVISNESTIWSSLVVLDQKNGMEKHLKDLASFGLLRRFIGMSLIHAVSSHIRGMNTSDELFAISLGKKLKKVLFR